MATNVYWHEGAVSKSDREKTIGQQGVTLWFTGLSGSGKSTITCELESQLFKQGYVSYRLDGDNIRMGLNKNLGFSPEDRTENIRRIGEVAKLMNDAGIIVMTAFISPYKDDRKIAEERHTASGFPFYEIYVDCPLSVAEERDPKGLYKKARDGTIKEFTGISAPYEAPENPALTIKSSELTIEEAAKEVIAFLTEKGHLNKQAA